MREYMKDGLRYIVVEGQAGTIQVNETDHPDGATILLEYSQDTIGGGAYKRWQCVKLDSTQLRYLGDKIVGWFDDQEERELLSQKLASVLEQNEARCLDDNIDRGVVLSELMRALRLSDRA